MNTYEEVAVKNIRREQLQALMDHADVVGKTGVPLVDTEFTRSMARLEIVSRFFTWITSKFQIGSIDSLDAIEWKRIDLKHFLPFGEAIAIDDAIDALSGVQRDLLMRIHTTGGVEAMDASNPLMVEYIQVNGQVKAMVDRILVLHRNTVVFKNIFAPVVY